MNDSCLLILEDDPDVACAARLLLYRHFTRCETLSRPEQLESWLASHRPDMVLLDMNYTPGRTDGTEGLALLARLRALPAPPPVIVLTAYADLALAVAALKCGACDFITKPWDNAKLRATVEAAMVPPKPHGESLLLGESAAMRTLRGMIASVAPTEANVLILGENGVGKELVAQAIHEGSLRAAGPLVTVDMGALPESTFDSELFGHRKGAFTDAREHREGRLLAANGGTLFLDEIGNLPLPSQAKLLRVLERREVTSLGTDRPRPLDVRVLSATNLEEGLLHNSRHFRPDLLFRLNTIVLRVPPLRERADDIPLLIRHFLDRYEAKYDKAHRPLNEMAITILSGNQWIGNVRALRHACERAVILAAGECYCIEDFGLEEGVGVDRHAHSVEWNLQLHERQAVCAALEQCCGNVSAAAKLLGLSRAALYRRMEKHGF